MLKLVNNLKESNEKLHLRVDEMEDRLDTIKNIKSETFREETRKMVRVEVYEVKEREARVCNLVIKGTEQIGKVDLENDPLEIGHMQSDEQVVGYLFKNILKVEDLEINKI